MNPREIATHNASVDALARMRNGTRWEYTWADHISMLSENGGSTDSAIEWAFDLAAFLGRKFEDNDLYGDDGLALAFAALGYLKRRIDGGDQFEYLVSMNEAWTKWKGLSAGQVRGILNCLRAEAVRQEADLAFRDQFPRIVEALHRAADRAADKAEAKREAMVARAGWAPATVIKGAWVLLPVGDQVIKLSIAGRDSKYTGDIHVAEKAPFGEGKYFGRIERLTGEVTPQLAKHTQILDVLRQLEKNPSEKIREFSRLMGRCAICGRELTNEKSIEAGIGPICADKVGW